ncbi:hypothetical protein [Bowmanella denitrificans]|nr:hypothetical protein [Bowmanella denitrificans]
MKGSDMLEPGFKLRKPSRRQAYYHGKYHRELLMIGLLLIALAVLL